jgi:hypothetical protein
VLRRKQGSDWTPAPAGDGPVPTYREDPVPSSPSDKTVSTAADTAGDASPDGDLGMQPSQMAEGDESEATRDDVQGPDVEGDRS